MKEKETKLKEIDVSHTPGGVVIHTYVRQSHGLRQTMPVWVTITDRDIEGQVTGEKCLFIMNR